MTSYSIKAVAVHIDPSARDLAQDARVGPLVAPKEGQEGDSDTYRQAYIDVNDYHREEGRNPNKRVQLVALPSFSQVGELGEHPFEGDDDD